MVPLRDHKIMEALHEHEGRAPIPCASSLWWGEATGEPAREDARPTNRFMAPMRVQSWRLRFPMCQPAENSGRTFLTRFATTNMHRTNLLVCAVTLLAASSQFSAISADAPHPDRTPYSEIRKARLQQQHPPDARPVRLKSEVFLPAGTLEKNLVHARSLHPDANRIHAIARFQRLPSPAQQAKLETFGIRVLQYLPDDGFLVSLSPSISPDQLRAAGMDWLGAIYSGDKLPPRVQLSGIGSWAVRAGDTADLRLKYYEDVDLKEAAKILRGTEEHDRTCRRACLDCLLDFSSQFDAHLLDRRKALDLLDSALPLE